MAVVNQQNRRVKDLGFPCLVLLKLDCPRIVYLVDQFQLVGVSLLRLKELIELDLAQELLNVLFDKRLGFDLEDCGHQIVSILPETFLFRQLFSSHVDLVHSILKHLHGLRFEWKALARHNACLRF